MQNGALSRFLIVYAFFVCQGCQAIGQWLEPGSESMIGQRVMSTEESLEGAIAIETSTVVQGSVEAPLEYTGTTAPSQDITLRAEVAGELVEMAVEVGDRVQSGQYLAQIDDVIFQAQVQEEQAELAVLEAELIKAAAELGEANANVEQVELTSQQAYLDNERIQALAEQGAVTQQEADRAQTVADTGQKAVESAEEQVRTRQAAVNAAQRQVDAQRAVLLQTQKQQANAVLTAPVTAKVLERFSEPGTHLQVGDNVWRLGNFNRLMITLQVSELDIAQVRLGQSVTITLDAYANESIEGKISQISPAADPISRLVPVEVSVPNPNEQIGSGLLARVAIAQSPPDAMVIPKSALEMTIDSFSPDGSQVGEAISQSSPQSSSESRSATVFVVTQTAEGYSVTERAIQLGREGDRLIEITSGLERGETIVTKSNGSLTDGQSVRISILSQ